jgi:hypothetical protein
MSRWCETAWRTCINSLKSSGAYGRIIEWRAWCAHSAAERYRVGSPVSAHWCAQIADRPPQGRLGA